MFGNLGNIAGLLKGAQEMQKKMAELEERLKGQRVEGSAGGDLVRVVVDGRGHIERVTIDHSLLNSEDKETLEELTAAACNQAVSRAKQRAQEEMSTLLGGLDVPPGILDSPLFKQGA
jgi:hypothetical protein